MTAPIRESVASAPSASVTGSTSSPNSSDQQARRTRVTGQARRSVARSASTRLRRIDWHRSVGMLPRSTWRAGAARWLPRDARHFGPSRPSHAPRAGSGSWRSSARQGGGGKTDRRAFSQQFHGGLAHRGLLQPDPRRHELLELGYRSPTPRQRIRRRPSECVALQAGEDDLTQVKRVPRRHLPDLVGAAVLYGAAQTPRQQIRRLELGEALQPKRNARPSFQMSVINGVHCLGKSPGRRERRPSAPP